MTFFAKTIIFWRTGVEYGLDIGGTRPLFLIHERLCVIQINLSDNPTNGVLD